MKDLIERMLQALRKGATHAADVGANFASALAARASARLSLKIKNTYRFECRDAQGNLRWAEEVPNLVTTVGLNDLLTKYFKGSAYTAAWYVGLVDGGTTPTYAAADTMASHAGWTENASYSNASRPAWNGGTAAAGSVDNSASQASFNINATATIAGAFLASDSTKSGTAGTLYGEASFGANRSVLSGDTLNVTVTLTAS